MNEKEKKRKAFDFIQKLLDIEAVPGNLHHL
jgi:hypothetical protein